MICFHVVTGDPGYAAIGLHNTPNWRNRAGFFPNEAAVTHLIGARILEQNDEWAITRHYMTLETVTAICDNALMDPAKIAAL